MRAPAETGPADVVMPGDGSGGAGAGEAKETREGAAGLGSTGAEDGSWLRQRDGSPDPAISRAISLSALSNISYSSEAGIEEAAAGGRPRLEALGGSRPGCPVVEGEEGGRECEAPLELEGALLSRPRPPAPLASCSGWLAGEACGRRGELCPAVGEAIGAAVGRGGGRPPDARCPVEVG